MAEPPEETPDSLRWKPFIGLMWQHPPEPQISDLPKSLQPLAKQQLAIYSELIESYQRIGKRAKRLPISADRFKRVEEPFDQAMEKAEEQVNAEIKKLAQRAENPERAEALQRDQYSTVMLHLAKQEMLLHNVATPYPRSRLFKRHLPPRPHNLDDTQPLMQAFERHLRQHPPKTQKDTHVTAANATELLTGLLVRNRGLAVGDVHTEEESLRLLTDNMPMLKKSGVDTIYMEYDPKEFDTLAKLSPDQLKQLVNDRRLGDLVLPDMATVASRYHVDKADDTPAAMMEMIRAARENGIRIVNVDKPGQVRNIEVKLLIPHRVASTNFTWPAAVEADRTVLHPDGNDKGKFIVWGGRGHFTEFNAGLNGMVDEALGIPVIAFDQRNKNAVPAVRPSVARNDADFYLPGGKDYGGLAHLTLPKEERPTPISTEDLGISALRLLPGMSTAIDALKGITAIFTPDIQKAFPDVKLPASFLPPAPPAPRGKGK